MATLVERVGYGETIQTGLSTELNSLTTGSYTAASSAIDNSTTLYTHMDVQLDVTYGTAPTAGTSVLLYIIPSLDGTNYSDSGTPQPELLAASFTLRNTTSAQKLSFANVPIPPGLFKLVAYNGGGQTMAASGNTVKYRRYYQNQLV